MVTNFFACSHEILSSVKQWSRPSGLPLPCFLISLWPYDPGSKTIPRSTPKCNKFWPKTPKTVSSKFIHNSLRYAAKCQFTSCLLNWSRINEEIWMTPKCNGLVHLYTSLLVFLILSYILSICHLRSVLTTILISEYCFVLYWPRPPLRLNPFMIMSQQ